jgi:hypothetical protein
LITDFDDSLQFAAICCYKHNCSDGTIPDRCIFIPLGAKQRQVNQPRIVPSDGDTVMLLLWHSYVSSNPDSEVNETPKQARISVLSSFSYLSTRHYQICGEKSVRSKMVERAMADPTRRNYAGEKMEGG